MTLVFNLDQAPFPYLPDGNNNDNYPIEFGED